MVMMELMLESDQKAKDHAQNILERWWREVL